MSQLILLAIVTIADYTNNSFTVGSMSKAVRSVWVLILLYNINLVDKKNLFVTSIRFIVSGVDE